MGRLPWPRLPCLPKESMGILTFLCFRYGTIQPLCILVVPFQHSQTSNASCPVPPSSGSNPTSALPVRIRVGSYPWPRTCDLLPRTRVSLAEARCMPVHSCLQSSIYRNGCCIRVSTRPDVFATMFVTTKPRDIRQLASECSQIMAGVYYVVTLAT